MSEELWTAEEFLEKAYKESDNVTDAKTLYPYVDMLMNWMEAGEFHKVDYVHENLDLTKVCPLISISTARSVCSGESKLKNMRSYVKRAMEYADANQDLYENGAHCFRGLETPYVRDPSMPFKLWEWQD